MGFHEIVQLFIVFGCSEVDDHWKSVFFCEVQEENVYVLNYEKLSRRNISTNKEE
jgi:hypothetical protein